MNTLKLTLRRSARQPGFALVNVGGMSIGLAACILAFLFVRDEAAYDRFHAGIDRIYEVRSAVRRGQGGEVFLETRGPVGPTLAAEFPEVQAATRIAKSEVAVQAGDKVFLRAALGVDPAFFNVFDFPLARGEAGAALGGPDSVILGEDAARLCFGSGDAVGRTIVFRSGDESFTGRVTGVLRKIPDQSSLRFDLLVPIQRLKGLGIDGWGAGPDGRFQDAACFVRLREGAAAEALEAKFTAGLDNRLAGGGFTGRHYLFPFARYHRGTGDYPFSSVLEPRGSAAAPAILAGVALLVLLIAGFNFMNLTVGAAAAGRVREIGVRKVLGAGRRNLFRQFRGEAMIFSLAGLAGAMCLASAALPVFNRFAGKSLRLDLLGPGLPLAVLVLLAVAFGAAAGTYPGWYLSRVRPLDLFRGTFFLGRRGGFSRLLLGFQFGLSVFLVITTAFLNGQHRLLVGWDLGYEPERVVVLDLRHSSSAFRDAARFFPVLKAALLAHPGIRSVSASESGMASWSAMIAKRREAEEPDIVRTNSVDEDFRDVLGLRMKEGRWFSAERPGDKTGAVVVNETFVRHFALSEPVGRDLSEVFARGGPGTIIGVVRDFHYDSLKREIDPAVIRAGAGRLSQVFVRVDGSDLRAALGVIEKEFEAVASGQPFVYSFLDDDVAGQYSREGAWGLMIGLVSLLAVLIACCGVFALTVQSTARKTKEIGIRKVLGASVAQVVGLVGREFAVVAVAATLAACPAAYLTARKMLAGYPYRVALGPLTFLAGGLLVIVLALSTVGLQAFLAGRGNPADSLRHE